MNEPFSYFVINYYFTIRIKFTLIRPTVSTVYCHLKFSSMTSDSFSQY